MPFSTTDEAIRAAEQELGVELPESLRARLRAANGGEIELAGESWIVHPVFDGADRKRAARSASHIVYETGVARGWAGFPAEAVSIGANGSGDRIVLLPISPGSRPLGDSVYLWDHETRELARIAEALP